MITTSKHRRLAHRTLALVAAGTLALSACGSGSPRTTDGPGNEAPATQAKSASSATETTPAVAVATAAGTAPDSVDETVAASVATDTAASSSVAAGKAEATDTKVADTKVAADSQAAAVAAANANVDANAIPKLKGEVGALADVTVKDCTKDGADWMAKGTLTNSSKAPADYVITTSFLDDKGTTLGLGWSKVEAVKAGDSHEWSVKAPAAGDKLQCIMRVTRGVA